MRLFKTSIRKNEGFTLVEVLVALLCVSFSTLLLTQCMLLLRSQSMSRYESEDRIAIDQLRILCMQGDQYQLQNSTFLFRYHGEPTWLEYHNRRLVRRDGYQIFLQDIDAATFHKKGDCYYAQWVRQASTQEALLACE